MHTSLLRRLASELGCAALALLVATGSIRAQAPAPGAAAGRPPIDFDRDVRPILSDKCFHCHGPDGHRRKAGLRLDTRAGAFVARSDGVRVIVPGDPAASELVRRVTNRDPDERMPPPDSGRVLTPEQIDVLVRWVEQGARWKAHWAFVAPESPPVPAVHDADWPRNEIDRFVLARLEREGLRPSPEADRRTLIRRLSLDLTGLPPRPEEVEAFVADGSEAAYEAEVDALLGSPQYAEHMARIWLDAARYGDTHGLHLDNYREMWPYRDWVISAFDRDMPFDRFAILQLAGDLLPEATLEDRIASGFNRCHVTTNEGGSIPEEVYVRNVVDRVSTTGTVFLGLTVGCAVCHDHKFDPISQKDFYQLFAFFNNLDGKAMDDNAKDPPPVVRVPSRAQRAQLDALRAQQAALEQRVAASLAGVEYREPAPAPAAERRPVTWIDDALPAGAEPDGELLWLESPRRLVHGGRLSRKATARGNQQLFFRHASTKLRVGAGDELFAWVYLDPDHPPRQIMLQWNGDGKDDWEHRAYWGENLIGYGTDGPPSRVAMGPLPRPGRWVELRVPAAAVGLWAGSAVHGMAFTQYDGTVYWDEAGLLTATPQEAEDYVWIDDAPPPGAMLDGDGPIWQWVDGPARSGRRCLKRSGGSGLNQDFFTGAPPLHVQHGDRLFAYAWLDPDDPPRSVQLQFHSGSWEHRARWGAPAHGAGRRGGADHVAGPLPPLGCWVRLEVELPDVGLAPGAAIDGWAFTQVGGTVYWDRAGVHTWGPPDARTLWSLAAWTERASRDPSLPAAVRQAAAAAPGERAAGQQKRLRDYYLRHVYAGTRALMAPLVAEAGRLRRQVEELTAAMPTTLVMAERAEPRPAFVLRRGRYDARGEQVERKTPAALPPMDPSLPRDRLGLARWLVSPDNPLTARVTVNRFWQQIFGIGLVKTSEDFGNQGQRPSHPELLDWLAKRFLADGWDVKQTLRRMVLSATYRQSSRATPEALERDPDNRLLARGWRRRLDAEVLRDQALALSGLLVRKVGGPSVKPPQPVGLWKAVGYVGSNTDHFVADTDPDKVHRRSLYTFFKRTAPPPELAVFDAPSRETCTVRRECTDTPLQALLLMNDPQYVEAARQLGQRALREGGDDRSRAAWLFRLVVGRPAGDADLNDVLELLAAQRAGFRQRPADAAALIAIGVEPPDPAFEPVELAAWTMVGNLLLNLDEVVTRS